MPEAVIIQHEQQVLLGHGHGKDSEALFYLLKYKKTANPFVVKHIDD